jgi:hypothetical protein
LPNLQVLDVRYLIPASVSQFISSIRHTPLLELAFHTSIGDVEGPPTAGLAGLEKLSISWDAYDNPNEQRSSLAHLYELIRPTLTTLVKLKIDNELSSSYVFDLQILKPTANTVQTFEYCLQGDDESILVRGPLLGPTLGMLSYRLRSFYSTIELCRTPVSFISHLPIIV